VGTSPLAKQVICLDHGFSVEDLANGLYPRVPIYPHLAEVEVPEEFRMVCCTRRGALFRPSFALGFFLEQHRAKATCT